MMKRNRAYRFVLAGLLSLSGAGLALAGDEAPAELELPEPVARLVVAMPDVKLVEPDTDGTFLIHSKMRVIGSRIMRKVEVRVAEDGTVLDWGRMPFASRVITQEQIHSTGQTNIGDALVQLDPSITIVR
ncbi:MAG: hypothetical protein ACNA7E_05775 [Wenzhouxiangellaceae bacterium]